MARAAGSWWLGLYAVLGERTAIVMLSTVGVGRCDTHELLRLALVCADAVMPPIALLPSAVPLSVAGAYADGVAKVLPVALRLARALPDGVPPLAARRLRSRRPSRKRAAGRWRRKYQRCGRRVDVAALPLSFPLREGVGGSSHSLTRRASAAARRSRPPGARARTSESRSRLHLPRPMRRRTPSRAQRVRARHSSARRGPGGRRRAPRRAARRACAVRRCRTCDAAAHARCCGLGRRARRAAGAQKAAVACAGRRRLRATASPSPSVCPTR